VGRLELAMLTFPRTEGSERAFADVRERVGDAPWLHEIGFVERHRNGRIVVRGTFGGHYVDIEDEDDLIGRDTVIGALTGALLGAAFGPAGFAAGLVAGGAVGGLAQGAHIPELHGELFDEVRANVPEGGSALVLLAAPEHVDDMVKAFEGTGPQLIRRSVSVEAVAALEAAVAQSPPIPQGPAEQP
jgi:uncharacterized membrane protein